MAMGKIAIVLVACSVCAGHGRRVPRPADEKSFKGDDNSQIESFKGNDNSQIEVLASLLSALKPEAAWQSGVAGHAHVLGARNPSVSRSRPAVMQDMTLAFKDTDDMEIAFQKTDAGVDYYIDGKLQIKNVRYDDGTSQGYDAGSFLFFQDGDDGVRVDCVIPKDSSVTSKILGLGIPRGAAPTESMAGGEINWGLLTTAVGVGFVLLLTVLLATNPTQ